MSMIFKLAVICSCVALVISINAVYNEDVNNKFVAFVSKYKKTYEKGSKEYEKRLAIFQENIHHYDKWNILRPTNDSAWYGINEFSDYTPQEFKEKYLSDYTPASEALPRQNGTSEPTIKLSLNKHFKELPQKVDWRSKNVITPVKNQQSCGGCWAFSTVETAESMFALKTRQLRVLSPQQVLDCSFGYNQVLNSCKGGDTCNAVDWMLKTQVHLVDDSTYPYVDKPQFCKMLPSSTQGVRVKNILCKRYVDVESNILQLLAEHGPVAVAVDATNWRNYLGGIIHYHCGEGPNNHAVQLIGYDRTGPIPYYIAKNSWGTSWGDQGYLYLSIGNNICGLAYEVVAMDVHDHRQTVT